MPLKQRKMKKSGKKKKSDEDMGKSQTEERQEEHKDDKIVIKSFTDNEVEVSENTVTPDIPFELVEIIMKFCVGVEYMNFRATCKHCYQAAPLIHWSQWDKKELLRLQSYSLVSPGLMVVDKDLGRFTFTDPLSGDNYFMKIDSWI
uniref:uncharacterized protein LOC122582598 n=1 Tax=Erigeron canadensis TaxID=72917 RepID=UPI001CB955D7|nr:uncharacterized protein LOC122582598 [Erigeron canadensis]